MIDCKSFFGFENKFFEEKNCGNTACEIAGQRLLWNDLGKTLLAKKREISDFMKQFDDLSKIRIILTGAGSSAFIGEALSLFIAKSSGIKCEAVHTTDIVCAPDTVLFEDIPTLLISFARSGNSPESAGAVQYARKKIKTLYEAAIVCDGASKLSEITAENKNNLILVMPEGSNDKGFAMTSSVTCMLLSGFALFNHEKTEEIAKDISLLSDNAGKNSIAMSAMAQKYAKKNFNRAVYLASGALKGIAHEGSLKMMELSNGEVNACFDSATGFRHGPKTVIKNNTLSLHLISDDPFTSRYDIDLLAEVYREKNENIAVAICADNVKDIKADDVITIARGGYGITTGLCYGISALIFFQMLAMFKSLELGVTTDNPSPGGQVNRVVKGVTVYPYDLPEISK
ncbi:MAG: SIS domain-containing protein [Treponema sp.]|nr:SIS domain-containing protein [Treponema sp.]